MSRFAVLAACLLLAGACHDSSLPDAADGAAPAASRVPHASVESVTESARFDGYGATRFGMDEAAFRASWQAGELEGPPAAARGSCFYLWPAAVDAPSDFAFMFEHGRFVRYDVGNAERVAPGGGTVGMRAADLRAQFPGLTERPHKYVPGGRYLRVVDPAGSGNALVFSVDAEGVVQSWRVGVVPQVDYVEGCS